MYRYRINAGRFKIPINIYSFTTDKNEDDIAVISKKKVLSTKAKVETLKPSGTVDADISDYQSEKRIIIRFPNNVNISEKNIIEMNGRNYTVIYINNINEENRYLQIRMKHCDEGV